MDNEAKREAKRELYDFEIRQLYVDIKYRVDLMTNPNVRPDMNDVLYLLNKINDIREINTQIDKLADDDIIK